VERISIEKLKRITKRLEDRIEEETIRVLRSSGWRETCQTPGSYWLWEKKLPDGRTVLVSRQMAVSIETALADAAEYSAMLAARATPPGQSP